MNETVRTKIAGEVPAEEAGAWNDVEQGIYNLIDGSCYLAEKWVSETEEMKILEAELEELMERLHKSERLSFEETERLSAHIITKQTKNARASFLVGFQQGIKMFELLKSANLAKTALELKII
ncbi:MAG: hypothetical protein Q4A29_03825 [Eubacteriales bacterium]|nr:hypothetical protein [Eubacteriales bacterium]